MIHLTYPTCKKVLKVPDEEGGRKVSCPKCGQRMLIPQPEKLAAGNRSVLGELTPSPLHGPTLVAAAQGEETTPKFPTWAFAIAMLNPLGLIGLCKAS
jgi:hypothetical protein